MLWSFSILSFLVTTWLKNLKKETAYSLNMTLGILIRSRRNVIKLACVQYACAC